MLLARSHDGRDDRAYVFLGRPVVDEARAQRRGAVDLGGREQDPPVGGDRAARGPCCARRGRPGRWEVAEADGRQLRLDEQLEPRVGCYEGRQQRCLRQVALDRRADRVGPVHGEREPQLQPAQRSRILERAVDRVELLAVRHVPLVVRERVLERLDVVHQQDAARLGDVQPFVGVDGGREGAVEALEEMAGAVRGRGREAVGAVDVEPDVVAADVGEALDIVDRAGQRRPRGGDDRHRGHAVLSVLLDRVRARGHVHPSVGRRSGSRGRSGRRCRAPRRRGGPSSAPPPSSRAPSCGRRRRRGGRPGAPARAPRSSAVRFAIVPPAASNPLAFVVEPHELPDPADRLRLEQVGGAGAVGDVDVVGGHQRVAEDADLEPRGADVGEPAGARLRERAVEHVGGCVQRLARVRRRGRERAAEQRASVVVGERLARVADGRSSARPAPISSAACSSTCSRSGSERAGPSVAVGSLVDVTVEPA